MTNLLSRTVGFVKSTFSLNTTIDSENKISFLENESELEYANGLAFCDVEGITAARKAGWILSLRSLWQLFNDKDHYLSIQTTEQIEHTLNRFAVGVLSCHQRRTGEAPYLFHEVSKEERFETGKRLLKTLFKSIDNSSGTAEVFSRFEKTGFLVCDLRRNCVHTHEINGKHQEAIKYIQALCKDTKIVVPIITTSLFIQTISRNHNLLEYEQASENDTVVFEPKPLTSTCKHS